MENPLEVKYSQSFKIHTKPKINTRNDNYEKHEATKQVNFKFN